MSNGLRENELAKAFLRDQTMRKYDKMSPWDRFVVRHALDPHGVAEELVETGRETVASIEARNETAQYPLPIMPKLRRPGRIRRNL